MRSQSSRQPIPLPRGWTQHVKSALLHAVSLAAAALTLAGSRATSSRVARHRLQAELDRATNEIALLKEELDIKGARWNRLPPRRRLFYTPVQRMRILQVKAWLVLPSSFSLRLRLRCNAFSTLPFAKRVGRRST